MEHDDKTSEVIDGQTIIIPVLPLRDVVVYPHMVIPLFVGREKSIKALEGAMEADKQILLVSQKSAEVDDPTADDIHRVGTLSTILQLLKLPDGTVKVLVEGSERAQVINYLGNDNHFSAQIKILKTAEVRDDREVESLPRALFLSPIPVAYIVFVR